MAEPQTNATSEEARAKAGASGATSGATAEPRSFEQSKSGAPSGGAQTARVQAGSAADVAGQAAQQMAQGGRQLAEQGRRAGRQMTEAWRQAFDPFLAMQYDMSQMFDDIVRQTFGFRTAQGAHPMRPLGNLSPASLLGLPPVDLKETENAHALAIELPGLTPEDVDISIDGDMLVVAGQKSEETDDATASYRVSERRYGRFERVFPLPPDIDRTKIEARFRDGVLKIVLPKNPTAAPPRSRIEIKQ
jgi:HSP20 family protein